MKSPPPSQLELQQGTDLDFENDAGDRLMRCVQALESKHLLEPAVRCAGTQLETLAPVVMGLHKNGFFTAGKVVELKPGMILFVLANATRHVTMAMMAEDGVSASRMIESMVEFAHQYNPPEGEWNPGACLSVLQQVFEQADSLPGLDHERMSDVCGFVLGGLFAAMPKAPRVKFSAGVDLLLENHVCPAIVAALGPASSGLPDKYCMAWPLLLPLAPYLEDVLDG